MSKTVVLAFGRMNPVHIGHGKLVQHVLQLAKERKADPLIFLSHTEDKDTNPLTYEDKIKYAQQAFGKIIKKSDNKTIISILEELSKKYTNLIYVAGSDRIKDFINLITKYNGDLYHFNSIEFVSAGERSGFGIENVSASLQRMYVKNNDLKSFTEGTPSKINAQELFNNLRKKYEKYRRKNRN